MIYFLEDDRLKEGKSDQKDSIDFRPCLGIFDEKETEEWRDYLEISPIICKELFEEKICKFESHDGFDYITVTIPNTDIKDDMENKHWIEVYYRSNQLLFFYEDEEGKQFLDKLLNEIVKKGLKFLSLERILYEFFDLLTEKDAEYLESIEEEIFKLEEALLDSVSNNHIHDIMMIRRELLSWKRYYEQLLHIAEGMQENENGLLSNKIARAFRHLSGRTLRSMDSIVNLSDYVSQVREAYQAQIDIKQNEIMKLFTVITAIFLPLTLIVGWYGMNLQMPEFQFAYAYPVVIVVSVIVAVTSYFYLKKKKWF
ncbi:CorA family divalent cation transporter [Sinanaerobacter sp. ZZT-01]|uniref:magnesium transporter CorA family protein n=1 Tax=Sinanaerobacter sp. ZZT-01 TaxID=3111540 RepID=UPI002D788D51|nr:CorA family divalent cation transporter [Sinanaerobacter sp. ZZT-01]WRR94612.1 CorA family divalent cation transporter [Sinanaerobacter sp. ZZT-01]